MDLISRLVDVTEDLMTAAFARDAMLETDGPVDQAAYQAAQERVSVLWERQQSIARQLRELAGIPLGAGR